jgi:hypothetical protein
LTEWFSCALKKAFYSTNFFAHYSLFVWKEKQLRYRKGCTKSRMVLSV